MIALSAIFRTVFMSPLLPVILISVGVVLLAARRRKTAAWLLSLTAFFILAFSTGAVRDLILRPLEYRSPPFPAQAPSIDAIVVLGGGIITGTPDEGAGRLSPALLKRVAHAAVLQKRLSVPVIAAGGESWQDPGAPSEAAAAAEALAELGVPVSAIIREGGSRTTWENAREVARILAARGESAGGSDGIRRVALVTSAWHMPRALAVFTRAGISCVPAPTDYLSRARRWGAADFLPGFGALEESFLGIKEYMGIVFYALRRPP